MRQFYLQLYRHTLSDDNEDAWVELSGLGLHPDMIQQLAEFGIVEVRQGRVPVRHARRLHRLVRLRQNLGVNLPGAAVILDLLERIEHLEDEIEKLKRNR
ncbi:chaperone modulator CbpM [Desulfallas thermosapovorans]|uniref:MerR family transcriptional regulator/heat shock protein HspR n=1 Tax=Desulfallas thermosapovorans DSM 6562 TaxID=1121431 RepID=A0A5S4ZPJ7_9FIRM|nr:chaperone modulator CbpM [Desulfallas thermosapovorans]TYO94728.1 MerR family transcriptional regulator/heat shock protein HspR [Desulfallas thermosapovorans DSM 6562]